MTIIKSEFALALNQIATERGISLDEVIGSIEEAVKIAYKKEYHMEEMEEILVKIEPKTGGARLFKDDKDITPPGFGRIAAQTAKQVIFKRFVKQKKNL